MMQVPNLPSYVQVPQQPNYNAVKIDVHNPMVNVPAQVPGQMPQYEIPTMPYYNYPQAPSQPYYMPPVITTPEIPQQTANQPTVAQTIPIKPDMVPPAPVVTENVKPEEKNEPAKEGVTQESPKATEQKVEVVPPQEVKPELDLNAFLAKLTNDDYDVQAAAMGDIADMVDKEPEKATGLLDTETIDALVNIINKDTSAVAGPTSEVEAERDKINNNAEMKPEEKMAALEQTLSDREKAERNKSYALYTTAILQKLYSQEQEKLNNATYPLTEIPGAVTVVQQLKGNPNPVVRVSAIEALSYIQQPNYKKDLNTIFTIAQKDADPRVQEAATAALAKLNEIPDEGQTAVNVDMNNQPVQAAA